MHPDNSTEGLVTGQLACQRAVAVGAVTAVCFAVFVIGLVIQALTVRNHIGQQWWPVGILLAVLGLLTTGYSAKTLKRLLELAKCEPAVEMGGSKC